MYTQCPDCGTSFRVTAVVLKQAAGKVRCGGCGNAFNALAYLSEAKPDPTTRTEPDGTLPELKPDPVDADIPTPPAAISPEQSAALLKTLDQLAGEDIRLEDTGVEWRIMDDDEDQAPAVDELLERAPTQVDQFLTKTPTEVEAGEIFDDPTPSGIVDAIEVFEAADEPATQTSAEELRFDDNTGLPDDFDFESDVASYTLEAEPEPEPEPEPIAAAQNVQVDLALGDPEDWGELLGEVAPAATEQDEGELAEEVALTIEEELEAIDDLLQEDSPSADVEASTEDDEAPEASADEPPDIDTQFGLQAEAMGIDLSGVHAVPEEDADELEFEVEAEAPEELEAEAEAPEEIEELEAELEAEHDFPDSTGALEFEIARAAEAAEALQVGRDDEDTGEDTGEDTSIDEDLIAAAFENEETLAQNLADDDLEGALDLDGDIDGKFDENVESLQIRLDDEPGEPVDNEPVDADEASGITEHYVPEPTEEENTINMQIDQELLALAIEDDDGFASTIAIDGKRSGDDEDSDIDGTADADDADDVVASKLEQLKETGSSFETIVMEGDVVRSALEEQAFSKSGGEKPAFVLPEAAPPPKERFKLPRGGMIAGIVVLALILIVQVVHQSRTALAKVPVINNAIAPIYRAMGNPINPDWNVSGWRFEVTKGSTNPIGEFLNGETPNGELDIESIDDSAGIAADGDEVLTIYSRLGNQSDEALPYPLISVALTDKVEETIGSKVLEPHEYLTGNFDPRIPVPPGNTFNAVIQIESPAAEATGFKLNVCYRTAEQLLRCALEDFK